MAINFIGVLPPLSLFSDSAWPSPSNRPTFSGSTLSWIGPLGGGANNGNPVQQSRVLTSSGSVSSTANNQIIEGLNINTGNISILHNNVIVRQNRVVSNNQALNQAAIAIKASVVGLILEDNLIDGQKNGFEGICSSPPGTLTSGTQSIFRRNFLSGFENHITFEEAENNVLIRDNYFTACGNSSSGTFDGDMIELYGCNNIDIEHNRFDGINSQTTPGITNSLTNLSNLAAVTNITINNNQYANCGVVNASVITDGPDFAGGVCTFAFTNNGFYLLGGKGYSHGIPGTNYTITANSGNYDAATFDATSGSLIGGTGQIS